MELLSPNINQINGHLKRNIPKCQRKKPAQRQKNTDFPTHHTLCLWPCDDSRQHLLSPVVLSRPHELPAAKGTIGRNEFLLSYKGEVCGALAALHFCTPTTTTKKDKSSTSGDFLPVVVGKRCENHVHLHFAHLSGHFGHPTKRWSGWWRFPWQPWAARTYTGDLQQITGDLASFHPQGLKKVSSSSRKMGETQAVSHPNRESLRETKVQPFAKATGVGIPEKSGAFNALNGK